MSILSDRRSLRDIGGVRAYVKQVGWSLWWRTQPGSNKPSKSRGYRLERSGPRHDAVVPPQMPAARARID